MINLIQTQASDEFTIVVLSCFALLFLIAGIAKLLGWFEEADQRDTLFDKYYEILEAQLNATIRLTTLRNMQKHSGKNYTKSIQRQKKLLKSLKRELEREGVKQKFKSNFKNISTEEKVKILESALMNRLVNRTKESMSSRISKREIIFLVTRESVNYYLGCNINDFIKHLELYFTENINWINYEDWHLDHKIPISSAENIDEFNALQHYKNIQPLYGSENVKKSNKYEEDEKFTYLEWYYNNIALPVFKKIERTKINI